MKPHTELSKPSSLSSSPPSSPRAREKKRKIPRLGNRGLRRGPQEQVDAVDIGKPTRWLLNEANTALEHLRRAQTNLQLLDRGREKLAVRGLTNLHTKVGVKGYLMPAGALRDVFIREIAAAGRLHKVSQAGKIDLRRRVLRVGRTSEALPWRVWPVRLKNHEGQDFYCDLSRHDHPYLAGGCTRGSEDDIHDHLLRRSLAVPVAEDCVVGEGISGKSVTFNPSPPPRGAEHHEATVKRLLPSVENAGGWIEVSPPPPLVTIVEMPSDEVTPDGNSGVAANADCNVDDGAVPSRESERFSSSRTEISASGRVDKKLTRLEPGWYGGWVEVETREPKRRPRRHASDATLAPAPMAAAETETETGERTAKGGRRLLPKRARGGGRADDNSDNSSRSQHVDANDGGDNACAWQGWTVSEPAKEAVRRVWARATRRGKDAGFPRFVLANNADKKKQQQQKKKKDRRSSNTVGRSCGSRETPHSEWDDEGDFDFRDPFLTLDEEEEEEEEEVRTMHDNSLTDRAPPTLPAVRERLDPVLLACLGRECEGIIDAALEVVLGDRLLRSRSLGAGRGGAEAGDKPAAAAATAATTMAATPSREERDESGDKPASLRPPPPYPHLEGNWEDVLLAMAECSSAARRAAASGVGNENVSSPRDSQDEGGAKRPPSGEQGAKVAAGGAKAWGTGDSSNGAVVVVNDNLPGLALNDAVLTRSYNRLLMYLHETRSVFGCNDVRTVA